MLLGTLMTTVDEMEYTHRNEHGNDEELIEPAITE
jgi:hypothetical protein